MAVTCRGNLEPGAGFWPLGVVVLLSMDLFRLMMLLPSAEVLGPTPS